jgi:hypothetical protein
VRQRGARFVASTLVVLAVSLLATSHAPAQAPSLRVSMFGDSVLLGAKEELLAQFAGQQVTVDAVEDRSLLGAVALFQAAGPALGDVVVLDLGYTDASDPTEFRRRIDTAMGTLAGVREVIWLNQHDWGPGRAGMNAELVAAQSRYPNLSVVDWNAEVTAHPDYVYADAIHLTPAGQNAMATVVRQHFDQWVDSLTPTTTSSTTSTTTTTTTRASRSSATRDAAAPLAADDESGPDRSTILIAAGVVVVLLVLGTVFSVGRRASRRARRGAHRGR